jgi:hypothetical protein
MAFANVSIGVTDIIPKRHAFYYLSHVIDRDPTMIRKVGAQQS